MADTTSDVRAQSSKWVAPSWADTLSNPYKNDVKATEAGKTIFNQLCAICHGNSGKGDGVAGMALNPRPANLTSDAVQSQSDGALYWKITTGRPPMASYRESLTDEQRWQVVNYIRQLGKKK
ncbi:MAG: cytochrome c [Calditrichaeota bacterium]|nr:cytochrome c [Calditrichota bacterium]